jgi:23S rRNA pseudouridine2605 synthase
MPPRFAYWTIILDGIATSFRARERDEILPLFNQQKKKDPTAQLKWFSGGKLWDSPEQAKEERLLERERDFRDQRDREGREFRASQGDRRGFGDRPMGPRPDRPQGPPSDRAPWKGGDSAPPADRPKEPRRSKDWRPGGEHKDPRDKYKLPPGEARKRWKQRHLGPGSGGPKTFGGKPEGPPRSPGFKPAGPPSTSLRPGKFFGGKPSGPGGQRPFGRKPSGPRRSPGFKPGGPGRNRSK